MTIRADLSSNLTEAFSFITGHFGTETATGSQAMNLDVNKMRCSNNIQWQNHISNFITSATRNMISSKWCNMVV
jgi:hypothetical protein